MDQGDRVLRGGGVDSGTGGKSGRTSVVSNAGVAAGRRKERKSAMYNAFRKRD